MLGRSGRRDWPRCKVCGMNFEVPVVGSPSRYYGGDDKEGLGHICDYCAVWAEAELAHAKAKTAQCHVSEWREYFLTHAPDVSSPLVRWLQGEEGAIG